jgi:hydrogenase maturation protein HypF
MAENGIPAPALGVAWDGTGLGTDGTIWGGEWFVADGTDFKRVAHFRAFPLPGGDQAAREPRRSAIGLLYAIYGPGAFDAADLPPVGCWNAAERATLSQMLARSVNAPLTSSAGRLFDAVSALLGIRLINAFEGQAAMELEWKANGVQAPLLPFMCHAPVAEGAPVIVDWEPMIIELLREIRAGMPVPFLAARFLSTLAAIIGTVAGVFNLTRVVMSGGCFQNRILTEAAIEELRARGFQPYWHQRIPPNDGGVAVGQIIVAAKAMKREERREKN